MENKGKQSRVKVVARVRPLLSPDDEAHVYAVDETTVETFNHRNLKENLQYEFHKVFNEKCSQSDVFEFIQPMLGSVFEGENASVLAYGPTGAGKTFTMLGNECDQGVIPRCINHIFTHVCNQVKCEESYTVKVSYLEVYNEKVHDLLEPKSHDLPIREDRNKHIFVTGLAEKTIHSLDQFNQIFQKASRHRTVAATKLNERSSRSHCVLTIKVNRQHRNNVLTGKLQLVDLAGSENNKRTGNKGIRLTESGAINKSLHALGQVVDALNHGRLVPYRDSKLTRMLQDSLGGNSHTLMVINIAPDQYWETYSTLNFAQKSKRIVNNTFTNESRGGDRVSPMPVTPPVSCIIGQSTCAVPRQPFLSPLLRVENTLHETSNRLQALEQALLKQMSSQSFLRPSNHNVDQTVVTQIENCKKKLERIRTNSANTDSDIRKPLFDFDSPLVFKQPKNTLKRKGFVSSAAPRDKYTKLDGGPKSPASWEPNVDLQEKHNEEILHILNSGNLSNLQALQTVGKKRAQLIYDWRQLTGGIDKITDLGQIPGLTLKWTTTFMKNTFPFQNNLVKVQ